jgi:hypothetical protein
MKALYSFFIQIRLKVFPVPTTYALSPWSREIYNRYRQHYHHLLVFVMTRDWLTLHALLRVLRVREVPTPWPILAYPACLSGFLTLHQQPAILGLQFPWAWRYNALCTKIELSKLRHLTCIPGSLSLCSRSYIFILATITAITAIELTTTCLSNSRSKLRRRQ